MCGKLVVPNVGPIHSWTGGNVRGLAGQGDVYNITTTYPIILDSVQVIIQCIVSKFPWFELVCLCMEINFLLLD